MTDKIASQKDIEIDEKSLAKHDPEGTKELKLIDARIKFFRDASVVKNIEVATRSRFEDLMKILWCAG